MPKLDLRLKTVAKQIRSGVHGDIGSDHGHLLVALLKSGRIARGIAIESKRQPWLNSKRALAGLDCDVRLGDGLDVLKSGEADSLSICGMGGQSIVDILSAHPERIPNRAVVQPNRRADVVRRFAFDNDLVLVAESIAPGHWPYAVMTFERSAIAGDPAYDHIDRELGFWFGPLNLKRSDRVFRLQLESEREYLGGMSQLSHESQQRLEMIERAIATCSQIG